MKKPTMNKYNKLAGSGAGGAAAIVLAFALAQAGIDMPIEVQVAAGLLITWLGGMIGTFYAPPNKSENRRSE